MVMPADNTAIFGMVLFYLHIPEILSKANLSGNQLMIYEHKNMMQQMAKRMGLKWSYFR